MGAVLDACEIAATSTGFKTGSFTTGFKMGSGTAVAAVAAIFGFVAAVFLRVVLTAGLRLVVDARHFTLKLVRHIARSSLRTMRFNSSAGDALPGAVCVESKDSTVKRASATRFIEPVVLE